jgi:hypothetical protein
MADVTTYDPATLDAGEVLIHSRSYDIATYRIDANTMHLEGRIRDDKPAGLFVRGDEEPLTVHDMTVNLRVAFPSMEILAINVTFEDHPHSGCPGITSAYQRLVGQSIAAGFTRFVNTTFGRQHGCTHIGALLKAMAPVAIQSIYSMRQLPHMEDGVVGDREWTEEERATSFAYTLNSCHIWDEAGDHAKASMAGKGTEAPVWITKRLTELDRMEEIDNWR